jgi:hypothetical protein
MVCSARFACYRHLLFLSRQLIHNAAANANTGDLVESEQLKFCNCPIKKFNATCGVDDSFEMKTFELIHTTEKR